MNTTALFLIYAAIMLAVILFALWWRKRKKGNLAHTATPLVRVERKQTTKVDPLAELESGGQVQEVDDVEPEVEVHQDVPGPLTTIPGVTFAKATQEDRFSTYITQIMNTLDEIKTDVKTLKTAKPQTPQAVIDNLAKARTARRQKPAQQPPVENQAGQ